MTVVDWLSNTKEHIRQAGLRDGTKAAASEAQTQAIRRITSGQFSLFERLHARRSEYVFEKDWDVLVVLDACRVDALREVAPEYDWLPAPHKIGTMTSAGSMSEEWMIKNFEGKYPVKKRNTAHVSWNAYTNHCLANHEWAAMDEIWRDGWDGSLGCVPPYPVTERAVSRWRETLADHMIVHYMQPHAPYRKLADEGVVEVLREENVGDRDNQGRLTIWKLLRRGEISREEAWEAYIDNLHWVLGDIDRLRTNLDAEKVVLTADHGDCFGEWGLYGHPRGTPAPELVKVPWVEIDATDEETCVPEAPTQKTVSADADERLQALGYK